MITLLKIVLAIIAGSAALTLVVWLLLAIFHFIKIYYDAYKANTKR